MPSVYELYRNIHAKGYVPQMGGEMIVNEYTHRIANEKGEAETKFLGNGEPLKIHLEFDRKNVFRAYFGGGELTAPDANVESTWLAGEQAGSGMLLPLWAERLIHSEVLVMQGKLETAVDYLLHHMGKQEATDSKS